MDKEKIKYILEKYKAGTASEEELAFIESWYLTYKEIGDEDYDLQAQLKDSHEILSGLIKDQTIKRLLWPKLSRVAAAAAVLLVIIAVGLHQYTDKSDNVKSGKQHFSNDIVSGSNKAILTLADGKKIILDDIKAGEVVQQSSVIIRKTNDGQLIYTVLSSKIQQGKNTQLVSYNTIETPRGGQYQINLPDGSKVWLNAASSLHFPIQFAQNERKMELTGEAYFEVARDKTKPFRVVSEGQIVEVIGTHFNVNSYKNEHSVKTTLLAGAVKVTSNMLEETKQVILKPGEQSVLASGTMEVKQADTEQSVAWKNGKFMFENESLESIMKMVSRWYDVEMMFEGNIAKRKFSGTVSRYSNISEVLEMLELTKRVHFEIEGRKIKVMKSQIIN